MQDELNLPEIPTKNLLTRMRERVEECFVSAEKHYGTKLPRCSVNFTLQGTSAGQAIYSKKQLRFNRKLAIENTDYFLMQTIPHEVAHILDFHLNPRNGAPREPHGNSWKKIMVEVFKIAPKRCHKLDVTSVKKVTRKYKYICAACDGKEYLVGKTKHLAVLRGNVLYCPKCGGRIFFDNDGQQRKSLKEEEL